MWLKFAASHQALNIATIIDSMDAKEQTGPKIPQDLESFLKRVESTDSALVAEKQRSHKIAKEYVEVRKKLTATLEDLQTRHTELCYQHKELKAKFDRMASSQGEREAVLEKKIVILEQQTTLVQRELESARASLKQAQSEKEAALKASEKNKSLSESLNRDLDKTKQEARTAIETILKEQQHLRQKDQTEYQSTSKKLAGELAVSEEKRIATLSQLQKATKRIHTLEAELASRSEMIMSQERNHSEIVTRKNEDIDKLKAQLQVQKTLQLQLTAEQSQAVIKLEGEKSQALEKALGLQVARDQEVESLKASLKLLEMQLKADLEAQSNKLNPKTSPAHDQIETSGPTGEIELEPIPAASGSSMSPSHPPPFRSSMNRSDAATNVDTLPASQTDSFEDELLSWEIIQPPAFKEPQNRPNSETPPPPRFRLLP